MSQERAVVLHRYSTRVLLGINLFFVALWSITLLNPQKLNILWFLVVVLLAVLFIVRNKNVSRTDVIIAVILGCLAAPSSMFMGVCSAVAYVGGVSVLKKSKHAIVLCKMVNKKEILKTICLALLVGLALGTVNILLAKISWNIAFSLKPEWFLNAMRAGISEEIIFRFFFFATCIYFIRDRLLSKLDNFLCYLVMILPHVLLHFNTANFALGSVLALALLFGLPFAVMQRKRDVSSAIGAHTVVDVIRFCSFGV